MNKGSKKISLILDYLKMDEEERKLCQEILYGIAIKIDEMLKIYNSDEIEVRKLNKMSKIFKYSKDLSTALTGLDEYETNNPKKEELQALLAYYKECDSKCLIDNSNYLIRLEEEGYFDDYNYAVYFIEEYINYKDSIYVSDFLKENGLTKNQFDRFVSVVSEFNCDLHQQFLKKYLYEKGERQYKTIKDINDLAEGIAKGNIYDGDLENVIEVYSKLPIYNEEADSEILDDFKVRNDHYFIQKIKGIVRKIRPNAEKDIISYIIKNSMIDKEQIMTSENEIYRTDFVIDGKELTKEDKTNIINFMKEERIPFLSRAFNIVKDEYIKGNLEKDRPKQLVRARK